MKSRLLILVVGAACWLLLASARLADLQVHDHERYKEQASDQQLRILELDPPRGTIYDARGRELAVSVPVDSLYAMPREIADKAAVAQALAPVLGVPARQIRERLESGRHWIWLRRKLDPPTAAAVAALGIEGIGFVEESKRYYPMRELAASVLGFVGTDDEGLRGLEYLYDDAITGKGARRPVIRDNGSKARLAFPGLSFAEPTPGKDLHLTLDAVVQHVLEEELFRVVEAQRARGGWAIILDPGTGAVLAMASYPTYDANHALEHPELERVRPVTDVFEPGSTFKVITAAAALEANLIDPSDELDCEMGGITLFGVHISDHKRFGRLTVQQVLARSSNVGAIKIGQRVGATGLYETIRRFGFGARTGIDLPGESAGGLRPIGQWSALSPAYISFGQGIAVTPVQLVAAAGAVASGGTLRRPYLVASITGPDGARTLPDNRGAPTQAISPGTARELERMLETVFEPGGTAYPAAAPGYRLAGKTGTAQKVIDGRYSMQHFVANFIGFAPARDPILVGLVAIDEPRAGITSGGRLAAPVFAAVAARVLPYLGVPPEAPAPAPGTLVAAGAAPGDGAPIPAPEGATGVAPAAPTTGTRPGAEG